MLDVQRLRILRELQRRGSLAAVASAFSYSPSAISQQLAQLERDTGVQLLEHIGRGVRLTAQAELLAAHADVILERIELAEAELAASLSEVSGTLRVASFQTVMLALIPTALSLLAERHPPLRVEIIQSEADAAIQGLAAHDFDVVLGEEYPGLPEPLTPGVEQRDLVLDQLHLVVPKQGPLARRKALSDYADAPWVIDPPDSAPGQWALRVCREAGFEPDIRFQSPDPLLHVHLVETGQAVALLPDLIWMVRSTRPKLIGLAGDPKRRLFTAVRRGAAAHPAIEAFQQALEEIARSRRSR